MLTEALRAGPVIDARSFAVAHAHLAAFWRRKHGHIDAPLAGIVDLNPLLAAWRKWVRAEVLMWFWDHPVLVRRLMIVSARSLVQRRATIEAKMDLWDALRQSYPMPPPLQLDMFDGMSDHTATR